ncbi:hypothetical protein A2Z33_02230 [Candidatus Gottesmanbacteria bacterium RBG_16_52_11]|uniref:Uncharacterized protein n=1 Tax=Candidatus Gottesmanbacteria bacterium RBG_16_52_11 TaxID=1798374 RepID=A0A1F5YR86_9BACT|nr:MAG: hypothetical protein A2Z33_02230 [Candidatus Gottesmanbacteria bacterium RBG_16_52_11]
MFAEFDKDPFRPPFCADAEVQLINDLLDHIAHPSRGLQVHEIAVRTPMGGVQAGTEYFKVRGDPDVGLVVTGQYAGYLGYISKDFQTGSAVFHPHRTLCINGGYLIPTDSMNHIDPMRLPPGFRDRITAELAEYADLSLARIVVECLNELNVPVDEGTFLANIVSEDLYG